MTGLPRQIVTFRMNMIILVGAFRAIFGCRGLMAWNPLVVAAAEDEDTPLFGAGLKKEVPDLNALGTGTDGRWLIDDE